MLHDPNREFKMLQTVIRQTLRVARERQIPFLVGGYYKKTKVLNDEGLSVTKVNLVIVKPTIPLPRPTYEGEEPAREDRRATISVNEDRAVFYGTVSGVTTRAILRDLQYCIY